LRKLCDAQALGRAGAKQFAKTVFFLVFQTPSQDAPKKRAGRAILCAPDKGDICENNRPKKMSTTASPAQLPPRVRPNEKFVRAGRDDADKTAAPHVRTGRIVFFGREPAYIYDNCECSGGAREPASAAHAEAKRQIGTDE
jgi:hypothetical protein